MNRIFISILFFCFFSPMVYAGAGDLSTQELLDNLKSENAGKREEAAEELGERSERLGLNALIEATGDKDQKVAMAAVKAINKINDPRRVEALSEAIKKTKGAVQKEAIHLLIRNHIPPEDKNALEKLLLSIEELFDPSHPAAVEPWTRVDSSAVDALIYVLDDKTSENRIQASASLGILRVRQAMPRLRFYLRSPNEQMVRTTVRSIGYIRDPSAGADLIPLLKHSDKDIVVDAARVLGQFRYKQALPELQHFLDYSNKPEYKRIALQAISRVGEPSTEPLMIRYLTHGDKEMRRYAIEGLGRMNAQKHLERLEVMHLRENEREEKMALSFTLYRLGRDAHLDPIVLGLDEGNSQDQSREYLIELGDRAVPGIAGYLRNADKEFKIKLIRVMGDMHQPRAIQYLEPYLKDKDLEIAQAATDAVRELKAIEA